MIHGILNIYKEKGYTSHDVVAKLRGIVKQKKIGHTGTLDPDAEGVLPVCLGKATKLCDLLTDRDKIYQTVMLLGEETDTQDGSGTVLQKRVVEITEEEVQELIESFVGDYMQIPPMYSALKVNGKKLYELARAGIEVERQARPVHIYEIQVDEINLPFVTMTVSCSKGTYIRTLCHDIGIKAGCGACMHSLLRTKAGAFVLEEASTLSQIEAYRDDQILDKHVIPMDVMFSTYPVITVKEECYKWLHNGNKLLKDYIREEVSAETKEVRVYDSRGEFFGIYEYKPSENLFKPLKILSTI